MKNKVPVPFTWLARGRVVPIWWERSWPHLLARPKLLRQGQGVVCKVSLLCRLWVEHWPAWQCGGHIACWWPFGLTAPMDKGLEKRGYSGLDKGGYVGGGLIVGWFFSRTGVAVNGVGVGTLGSGLGSVARGTLGSGTGVVGAGLGGAVARFKVWAI
jgi:hypothetical protein